MHGSISALAGAQKPSIDQVATIVNDSYANVRGTKLREHIILPNLGPDFLKAEKLGASIPQYLQPQAAVYGQLTMLMNQFNLQLDIIVAGVDEDGARIAVVTHPGTIFWLDKLGYAAIGSGGIHANMRLALGCQTKGNPLAETLYCVFDAKKASEVAPGVGQQTDLAIIGTNKTSPVEEKVTLALAKVFEESRSRVPAQLNEIEEVLK